mmetsp:Transcript_4408/g.6074  ORF Transcript_4408/g.6074 Transcript_4408/m.6074 type:complete len:286 (-) Transcript_4408:436-1293(-)
METLKDLNPEHQDQIRQFLKFFRSKREVALQALSHDFEDIKSDRLYEDMYSQDDVVDLLDNLFEMTQSTVKTELANTVNMTVLLMKQLFEKADEQDVHLEMDTGAIEDQALLNEIENMNVNAPAATKQPTMNKLVSIKDEHAKLVNDSEQLGKTNQQLQERFNALQAQTSEILKEKSALARQVTELNSKIRMMEIENEGRESEAKEIAQAKNEIDPELQQEIDALKGELSEAKEENAKKLNESKQYAQMRKIINTKSEQIKELRQRLAMYEQDDVEGLDSDEDAK